jgi:putative endonuclease
VLARRVRTAAGEIDLVAEREGLLRAGECWLAANPGRGGAGVRFDLLLVAADGTVRRIADAFRLE